MSAVPETSAMGYICIFADVPILLRVSARVKK